MLPSNTTKGGFELPNLENTFSMWFDEMHSWTFISPKPNFTSPSKSRTRQYDAVDWLGIRNTKDLSNDGFSAITMFPASSFPTAERKTGFWSNFENAEARLKPTPPVAVRIVAQFDEPLNSKAFSPFHIQSKLVPPTTNGRF